MTKRLSPAALNDLRRLHSYGWLPGRIAAILNRMHGLSLTPADIKQLCKNELGSPALKTKGETHV